MEMAQTTSSELIFPTDGEKQFMNKRSSNITALLWKQFFVSILAEEVGIGVILKEY